MKVTVFESAARLLEHDKIMIICHTSPDGDTLGSAFALYNALKALKKTVKVVCSDNFPDKFDYLYAGYESVDFKEEYVVAVDVAALQLLGEKYKLYGDKIDLCIDHHGSNEMFAKDICLDQTAAAACEIIYEIIKEMKAPITKQIANCLYTGIATDTGCFKYSNTTANTHMIAAGLFKYGADFEEINRYLFDTKSKGRLYMEQLILKTVEFFYNDRVALISITKKMIEETGFDEADLDGVSALPRTIEGVKIGICIREKSENAYKISVRTTDTDASLICKEFSGGGHQRAAGCFIEGDLETVKSNIINTVGKYIV